MRRHGPAAAHSTGKRNLDPFQLARGEHPVHLHHVLRVTRHLELLSHLRGPHAVHDFAVEAR